MVCAARVLFMPALPLWQEEFGVLGVKVLCCGLWKRAVWSGDDGPGWLTVAHFRLAAAVQRYLQPWHRLCAVRSRVGVEGCIEVLRFSSLVFAVVPAEQTRAVINVRTGAGSSGCEHSAEQGASERDAATTRCRGKLEVLVKRPDRADLEDTAK